MSHPLTVGGRRKDEAMFTVEYRYCPRANKQTPHNVEQLDDGRVKVVCHWCGETRVKDAA
jgi:hypothetical protein